MKRAILISVIALIVMSGCGGKRQADAFITVDVKKTYSEKKELILQDFMDVEYIKLETNDDFVNQGVVMDIGKKIMLVKNRVQDGNIFVYDRTGKALRKINRRGQGPEEYTTIFGKIVLDEENNEMFVNMVSKIVVYDLSGNFKRSFENKTSISKFMGTGIEGASVFTEMRNYDKDNLICYDEYNSNIAFALISKQDGRIIKEIPTPYKKMFFGQLIIPERKNAQPAGYSTSLIPFNGNWLLSEHSSDTIYSFLPDYSVHPFIARTPSIQKMDPEVFLMVRFLSDRYYFLETITNEYDWSTERGFPRTFMMYDKNEKNFFGYNVYNNDYTPPKEIYMNWLALVNHEIAAWLRLEAYQLVDDYKKGILKGKLKEIAATLDAEDNPVIMLVKYRQ